MHVVLATEASLEPCDNTTVFDATCICLKPTTRGVHEDRKFMGIFTVRVLSPYLYSLSLSSAVFVLITYTDRTSLYCGSEYLIVFEMRNAQLVGSTAFCTMAGL